MPILEYYVAGQNLVGDVFIETGLHKGGTLAQAAWAGFLELHSIDIVEEYIRNGRERFEKFSNVTLHHGSSPDILPKIMNPRKRTTFFLDAHYQGGEANECDSKYGECPLMAELAAINRVSWKHPPIIAIDDVTMYLRPWEPSEEKRFDAKQWPTVKQIEKAFPEHTPFIRGGILYLFPPSMEVTT